MVGRQCGSNFQLPQTSLMSLTPTGTQILSQISLDLSNSVKMFIVCCPGFQITQKGAYLFFQILHYPCGGLGESFELRKSPGSN